MEFKLKLLELVARTDLNPRVTSDAGNRRQEGESESPPPSGGPNDPEKAGLCRILGAVLTWIKTRRNGQR
jgi:hypothetical protein